MSEKLRLEVLLSAVDKVTGPLKRMLGGSAAASRGMKDLRDKLKQLEQQSGLITKFRNAHKSVSGLTGALAEQQAKVKGLAIEQAAAGTVTSAMARQMKAAKTEATALKERLSSQRIALQALRDKMGAAGVATTGLSGQEKGLRANIEQTNAALARQRQRFKDLSAAQTKYGRLAMHGAATSAAGLGMLYGSRRAAHGAGTVLGEGKNTAVEGERIKALGLDPAEADKAIKFAKGFSSFGTSQLDNLMLMRDAITVFNNGEHAKDALPFLARMKFSNEAMFGAEHGADNERKFMDMLKVIEMRKGANSREDFERNGNLIQQVITATGGRVGAEDWLNLIKTGGIAAKGIDEKEFFYRLEPLVQEMGGHRVGTGMMSAYQNIYQGKTTKRAANMLQDLGLIADPSKVKQDKVGQIAQLGVGALKGSDIFQRSQFEWMEKILIPALNAKGITSEKQILDAMGGIFSNRNAAGLFGTMYQQRAMINKSYALNEHADNVDTMHGRAQNLPTGKEIDLRKRRDDLYNELSTTAMPAYVKLLEVVTSVTRGMVNFAKEHPLLTKAMVYAAGAALLLVGAIGALAIPVGLILAKGAVVRFLLARLGVQFSLTGLLSRGASFGMGLLSKAGTMLVRAFVALSAGGVRLMVGLMALGVWLLANPIGIAIGLLAVAAYMLYSRWADVVGGFKLLMGDIGDAVMNAARYVWGLGSQFYDAGAAIVQGMANGITSRITAVRDAISMAAGDAVDWFKEKLGIHSPSRVFMQLGSYVGEGAALGIQQGAGMVRQAALGMAAATMVPMAAMGAPAAAGPGVGAGSSYQITINAAPGMDAQAIASAVAAELDRRERGRESRRFSRLSDID